MKSKVDNYVIINYSQKMGSKRPELLLSDQFVKRS